MGLYLLCSSKLPSFKIGETSAIFQEHGKIPMANEAFIIDVKVSSTAYLFIYLFMDSYKYRCLTIGHKSPTWLIHPHPTP